MTMTEKDLKKYFDRPKFFKKWKQSLTVLLIVLALCIFLPPVGIPLAVIIGLLVRHRYKSISDATFDRYKQEEINRLFNHALAKLRLDRSELVRETSLIVSPTLKPIAGVVPKFRRGKDHKLRYTPIGITMLFYTEHKLAIYQCALDLFTHNPLNDRTYKYFYSEIVAIQNQSVVETYEKKDTQNELFRQIPYQKKKIRGKTVQINLSEKFIMNTRGGTAVEIEMPNVRILNGGLANEFPDSRAEQAIASVEEMLDAAKQATV